MTSTAADAPSSRPALLRMAILAATLVAVGLMLDRLGLRDVMATQWVDHQIKGHGWIGLGLFLAVGALSMAVGVPRQVTAFLGGYAFGLVEGSVLAVLAAVVAATGGFFYARYMGREWLARRFPKASNWLDQFLSQNTFAMVLALRLVPFSSNLATNLAVGVSGAPFPPFLAASVLGYLPQTVAFALLGQGTTIDPLFNGLMVVFLILTSSALGLHMWRKSKQQAATDGTV